MVLCVVLPLLSVGEVAQVLCKVVQAQALRTGLRMVAGMVGTQKGETDVGDMAVVVDTVALAEQQGTCAVLASAVDAHQGQDQTPAFVGSDQELAQTWEYRP